LDDFMKLNADIGTNQIRMALLASLGMIAAIGSVLGFQHIGGYVPCELCYLQREPYYYVAMPAGFSALLFALVGRPAVLVRLLLLITFIGLLATAGIGAYHSGVEWGFWPGPDSCGAAVDGITGSASDLLSSLAATKPPSCNEAAGRFLGISFSGWNVIVSLIMASMALHGALGPDE
jgi:disulfide bond formation protein DsbB